MVSCKVAAAAATLVYATAFAADHQIDPNSVSNSTKQTWCNSQTTECPAICVQTTDSSITQQNSCDPDSLTYSCVCGNGVIPNTTQYTLTLPYFICTAWGQQCISNCGSDNDCSSKCQQEQQCGAQDPRRANSSLLTSTSSKSASAKNTGAGTTTDSSSGQELYTGLAGSGAASSTSAAAAAVANVRAAALNAGQTFGVLGLVGVFFGGFAVLL